MAVFSVKSGEMSEEEIREYRLRHTDFIWWCDNSPKFVIPENRGKYIAVVNQEAFLGNTYQEAEEKAIARYPNRSVYVHRVPSRGGKRI